jgi:hypothetical protein
MTYHSNKLLNSDLDMLNYYKSKTPHLPPLIEKKDLMVTDFQNPLKNFMNHSLSKFRNVSVRTVMSNKKLFNKTTSYLKTQKNELSNSNSGGNNLKINEKDNANQNSKLNEIKSQDDMLRILNILNNKSYPKNSAINLTNENDEELQINILSKMQFYNTTMNSKFEPEHVIDDKEIYLHKISINKHLKQSQNVTMNKFYLKRNKNSSKFEKEKEHVRKSNLNLLDINFRNIKKNKELIGIQFDKTREKEIYIDAMNYKKYNNYNLPGKSKINRGRSIVFVPCKINYKELII